MYTNKTPNYELPQYVGTDHIDPVADFNPAFEKIDLALKENANGNTETQVIAENARATAQTLSTDFAEMQTEFTNLTQLVNELSTQVSELNEVVTGLGVDTLSTKVTNLETNIARIDSTLASRQYVVTKTSAEYSALSATEKNNSQIVYCVKG